MYCIIAEYADGTTETMVSTVAGHSAAVRIAKALACTSIGGGPKRYVIETPFHGEVKWHAVNVVDVSKS